MSDRPSGPAAVTRAASYKIQLLGDKIIERAVLIIDPVTSSQIDENDPTLGARGHGENCKTCGWNELRCPGHLGAYKVLHLPLPITSDSLIRWLSIVCANCGRIALSKEDRALMKMKGKSGFKGILSALHQKGATYSCPYCSYYSNEPLRVLRPYVRHGSATGEAKSIAALFYLDQPGKKRARNTYSLRSMPLVSNAEVQALLKQATSEDCDLVGFDYYHYSPAAFVTEYIPISPPAARPKTPEQLKHVGANTRKLWAKIEALQRDIAQYLITRSVPRDERPAGSYETMARIQATSTDIEFERFIESVYYLYYISYIIQIGVPDFLYKAIASKLSLPTKPPISILASLKGKKGFMRANLASTRHNVNIRTPLAGDTYGALGTITIPRRSAMKVLRPMMVNPSNLEEARLLAYNGPTVYPGAGAYIRGGDKMAINEVNRTTVASSLMPGDILLRHTLSGDIALHQRYPSNREESISAVIVEVVRGNLIRLPPPMCRYKMADYDGDDTQAFFNSCLGVDAEAILLQSILHQLVAPQDGTIGYGVDDDVNTDPLSGMHMLWKRNAFSRDELRSLMDAAYTSGIEMKCEEKDTYTATDILDALLPRGFYYSGKRNGDGPADLEIEDGRIVAGKLTIEGIMYGNGYLTKAMSSMCGAYTAILFLENLIRILYRSNATFGISVADDFRVPLSFRPRIEAIVEKRVNAMDDLSYKYHSGEFIVPVGRDPQEYYELRQASVLAALDSDVAFKMVGEMMAGSATERAGYYTPIAKRLLAGLISRSQVMLTDGTGPEKRPSMVLNHGTRHNWFSARGDDRSTAAGHIASSYVAGLSPLEQYYEAAGDRYSFYMKGSGVREQGYLNRKLSTSLDPVYVDHLGIVRGHSEKIVSFSYGLLGSDPRCVHPVVVDLHVMSEDEFQRRFAGTCEEEMRVLRGIRDEWRQAISDYAPITSNENYDPTNTRLISPINLPSIISSFSPMGDDSERPASREEMWGALKCMDRMCEACHVGKRAAPFLRTIVGDRVKAFMRIFRPVCHSGVMASPRGVGGERVRWGMTRVKACLAAVLKAYALSIVAPGDPVGKKASLGIAYPQSQSVLHSTRGKGLAVLGEGSRDMLFRTKGTSLYRVNTEGVRDKNPIISFMLNGEASRSFDDSMEAMRALNGISLKDVLIEAHLISLDPSLLVGAGMPARVPSGGAGSGEGGMAGLEHFSSWLHSLPSSLKRQYERIAPSWFFIVLRIDVRGLFINRIDPSRIARRIVSGREESINFAVPVFANDDGMYVIINVAPISEMDAITRLFDEVVGSTFIHGHSDFSNGSVIRFMGQVMVKEDGGLGKKEGYRISFNGSDIDYLFSLARPDVSLPRALRMGIDPATITISGASQSAVVYGIEESRFREFDVLAFECNVWDVMKSIQPIHNLILADFCTHRGTPTFITRSGIGKREDMDMLEKIAFETAGGFIKEGIKTPMYYPIRTGMASLLYGKLSVVGSGISAVRVAKGMISASSSMEEVFDALASTETALVPVRRAAGTREVAVPIDRV
jgi:DNA-directed RNA polymerase subunit A'